MSTRSRASFSKCGIQKFSGRQYRTSRCLDNGFMEECIAAGKEHKRQTRKCTPSCNQKFMDSKPPPKYLYEKDLFIKKNEHEIKVKHHISQSDDYELVTIGDVEEIKRRKSQKNSQAVHNHNSHIKEVGGTPKNLSNLSFARQNEVLTKVRVENTQGTA